MRASMKMFRVKRMNFIARKGMVLDYQHLTLLLGAWFIFLGFVTGVEHARLWYVKHSMDRAKAHLAALMQDQERRLAMLQLSGPKVDRTKQQDLIAMFQNPPHWSRVLQEIQDRIPPHVRLTQVKSTEDAKENKFRLRMEGDAPSMRAIVEFMQRIQTSTLFHDVSLSEAKRDEKNSRIFTYAIEMQVMVVGT
jgi:Tfp pilus assembly protein PilN